MFTHMT